MFCVWTIYFVTYMSTLYYSSTTCVTYIFSHAGFWQNRLMVTDSYSRVSSFRWDSGINAVPPLFHLDFTPAIFRGDSRGKDSLVRSGTWHISIFPFLVLLLLHLRHTRRPSPGAFAQCSFSFNFQRARRWSLATRCTSLVAASPQRILINSSRCSAHGRITVILVSFPHLSFSLSASRKLGRRRQKLFQLVLRSTKEFCGAPRRCDGLHRIPSLYTLSSLLGGRAIMPSERVVRQRER